tara:strand:+ start:22251 stop:22559 length:309 start_codon:yes stop_codon:yes gene_type:complete
MPDPHKLYKAVSLTHRGKPLSVLSPSPIFSKFIENMENSKHKIAIIPEGVNGRPDLIALKVYDTEELWWVIMLANKILDAKTELISGKKIFLPFLEGYPFKS